MSEDQYFNDKIINLNDLDEKTPQQVRRNITLLDLLETNRHCGSGFLCKICVDDNDNKLPVLITCHHLIEKNYFEKNNFLKFSIFEGKKEIPVKINLKLSRIIYCDENEDVTIIEIKNDDNLYIHSFLEMDNSINVKNPQILYTKIYALHFPKGSRYVGYSQGEISDLFDEFSFNADYKSEPGSSGCPIIDYEKNLVVGIHRGVYKYDDNIKLGIILKSVIKDFIQANKEAIQKVLNESNLYFFTDTMDLIYLIPKDKSKNFFSKKFKERYKYKTECKIIYNGSKHRIDASFETLNLTEEDKNKGVIMITLKGIEYIKDMSYMFYKNDCLKKVIASKTDMRNVENMRSMFERCDNLEELSDVSFWNIEKVKSLRGFFYKSKKIKKIPGMNKWNPVKLETCEEMFFECHSLDKSQIEQVNEWKKVSQQIKEGAKKGYSIKNISDRFNYVFGENLGNTLDIISGELNKFNK